MRPRKILTGLKFGRLTAGELIVKKRSQYRVYYKCICDCGKEKEVKADHLIRGMTKSCGCLLVERRGQDSITHGHSYNPLYFVWYAMMDRCYKKSFVDYRNYGGRGIIVEKEWHDLSKFILDMSEGYQKGLQLDRVDNDGNYCKSNCRWATRKENNRNKRTNKFVTINGKRATLKEWSEITGIGYPTLSGRVKRGWQGEDIIRKPAK